MLHEKLFFVKISKKHFQMQTKIVKKALSIPFTRKYFFDTQVRKGIMKQTKGLYPAPLAIANVLEKSAAAGFGTEKAYEAEAAGFGELTMEPVTKVKV